MILPQLFIAPSLKKGRGVFTSTDIPAKTIIETSPVIVISGADRLVLDQTLLHDYIFDWGYQESACCLGLGYISLYNHSYQSNCEYIMDYEKEIVSIQTIWRIKAGEELFINYNGDLNNNKKVWFDTR
jgi:SET domain-containing protein